MLVRVYGWPGVRVGTPSGKGGCPVRTTPEVPDRHSALPSCFTRGPRTTEAVLTELYRLGPTQATLVKRLPTFLGTYFQQDESKFSVEKQEVGWNSSRVLHSRGRDVTVTGSTPPESSLVLLVGGNESSSVGPPSPVSLGRSTKVYTTLDQILGLRSHETPTSTSWGLGLYDHPSVSF